MQIMQIATSRAAASDTGAAVPEELGGREAKRERTYRRMEKAAVELALQYGSEHITVEQICSESDVSSRTFFNYFGTKEAALIGRAKRSPTPELREQFIAADGPVLSDLLRLITASAFANQPDIDLIRSRRRLFESEPELAIQSFARTAGVRDEYMAIAAERIRRSEPTLSDPDVEDEARVATAVLMGVMHVVGNRWLESDGTADLDHLIDQALDRLRRLV